MKKNIKIDDISNETNVIIPIQEKKEGLFDELSDSGKIFLLGIAGLAIIAIILLISFLLSSLDSFSSNSSINSANNSINCTDNSNYASYEIPSSLPNTSMIVKDFNCNDYCYIESCRYGCQQWINLGLGDGKCQCDLKYCTINVE